MKPRKKWQPDYRFGGNPAACMVPAPLGAKVYYHQSLKAKRPKKSRK